MFPPRLLPVVALLSLCVSGEAFPQQIAQEAPASLPHARQRQRFKALLLSNPNYFGNLTESQFEPVLTIAGNTTYEELVCVGYEPQQKRLNGVVYVKQPFGYGGGVCTDGTPEYVRFYSSFDGGATWKDEGATAFRAYDIPGTTSSKRLEYAVSLTIDPPEKFCTTENLALVRAILSWNQLPPPNQPAWKPVWGNVHNTHIQIQPRPHIIIDDITALGGIDIPDSILNAFKSSKPLAVAEPLEPFGADVLENYKEKKVEPLRYAFPTIQKVLSLPSNEALSVDGFSGTLEDLQVNIPDLIDQLFPNTGNTKYENLDCIGLNTNQDTLEAVIRVRLPFGYGGELCTKGSTEYVTFWADFDGNGSLETCLGTASVRVHDIASVPKEGLEYAVHLPIDLKHRRKLCTAGAKVVRVRAILSWQTAPPCGNPNYVPVWGTRRDTLVHITPGPEIPPGKFVPLMSIVGGIPVKKINPANGMTTNDATFALNGLAPDGLGRPCPFGRRVVIQGPQFPGHKYRVQVRRIGDPTWTTVTTPVNVVNMFGDVSKHFPNSDGMFTYLPFTQNIANVLAWWDTNGDDTWQVRLQGFSGGVLQGTNALPRIQLDNTRPDAAVTITSGGGDCGKFSVGDVLAGRFVARDLHFRNFSLVVKPPINPTPVGIPSPSSGTVQTLPPPGNTWSLNTSGMQPCGYIIEVIARDRSILNSATVGHRTSASTGFCLEEE